MTYRQFAAAARQLSERPIAASFLRAAYACRYTPSTAAYEANR